MEQQKLMDELNYHRAQKLTDALYHSGLISFEEYDKLTLKNRHSFSPIYVDLLPKTLAIKTTLCYNMNKNTTVALINVYIMT